MKVTRSRADFLSNSANKNLFIQSLVDHLVSHDIDARQGNGDADIDIVRTAIQLGESQPVVLIGKDTDLLILLLHYAGKHSSQIPQF